MISDHFWKILAVLALLIGGFFWYKNYSESRTLSNLSMELAEFIAFTPETIPEDDEEAHSRFLKAIALVYNARESGTDVGLLADGALTHNELKLSGSRAGMIRKAIFEAEKQGRELGIFNEASIWDLQDGQKVKITEGPYAGDEIAILRRVPASVAKGAEFFPGNFVLVPESVAAMSQDLVITEDVRNASGVLAAADVISAAEANLIKKHFYRYRDNKGS